MKLPDGFLSIEKSDLQDFALNINFTLNEFSAFARSQAIETLDDTFIVDRYYGHAYSSIKILPAAIYGKTQDLPLYSGDELANNGFFLACAGQRTREGTLRWTPKFRQLAKVNPAL
jgi:hypothetical protein